MVMPQTFQSVSNVLPSYEYIDFASGTGIIEFFAGKTVDKTLLSDHDFYSEPVLTTSGNLTASSVKELDIDFDVLLNRPINLSGTVVLNVPVKLVTNTSPNTVQVYVIAKVRKWDGSTETDICNNQSNTYTITNPDNEGYKMLAIDLTIPLTHFKIGEYLRLTIEAWATCSNGGTTTASIGHDPMNRSDEWDSTGAVPSRLTFQVPTRLNL